MTTDPLSSANSIQELCKDKKYCLEEVGRARQLFGDRRTTRKQFDCLISSLLFMLAYCPEECRFIIEGTFREASMRQAYFELGVWEPLRR